ncbi:unnamed protein product [Rhizophagus irregularis]|nr:unnamed protein product [Rhizophagus irregularis]
MSNVYEAIKTLDSKEERTAIRNLFINNPEKELWRNASFLHVKIMKSSALSQLKLSKIDEHFRIPYYSNDSTKQLKSLDNIPKKASFAVPMMIYQTEPSFKLDMSQLGPVFDHNIVSGKLLKSSDDYLNIAEEVKQEVARSHSEAKNIPGKDVIITTLGTGSTFPSKYRNVSATLIKIPNNGFILLDVGEGTLGSMSRHFGPYDQPHGDDQTSLESCISSLKCILYRICTQITILA